VPAGEQGWTPDFAAPESGRPRAEPFPQVDVPRFDGSPHVRNRADTDDDEDEDLRDLLEADPDPGVRLRGVRLPRRWLRTWVPDALRDSRFEPSRRAATVLLLVAALAATAAAIGVWRSRPVPQPVSVAANGLQTVQESGALTDRSPVASSGGAGRSSSAARSAAPTVSSTAPAVLVVSVTGRVRQPGIVRVPPGSRIADAVAAAGGLVDQADMTGLNLAQPVADGQSIVVGAATTQTGPAPSAPVSGGAASNADPSAPVDLNTADVAALDTLPGVGPATAQRIVDYREQNGPFTSVDQLQQVSGIGPAKFAEIAPHVTVTP
jgi:competence protein ComEA